MSWVYDRRGPVLGGLLSEEVIFVPVNLKHVHVHVQLWCRRLVKNGATFEYRERLFAGDVEKGSTPVAYPQPPEERLGEFYPH